MPQNKNNTHYERHDTLQTDGRTDRRHTVIVA